MQGGALVGGLPGPEPVVDAIGMFWWDRATRTTDWDAATTAILGLPPGTAPSNRLWWELMHPDDRPQVRETGDSLPRDARSFQYRYRVVRPDGSVVQIIHVGVAADPSGPGPHRYVGVVVDWTTAHDAVDAVEDALVRADSVVRNSLDPLLELEQVLDEQGAPVDLVVADVNPAALDYIALPAETIIGASVVELVGGTISEPPFLAYRDMLRTGEPLVLDGVEFKNPFMGDLRTFDLRVYPAGGRIAVTWRDVTERHQQQQALEASERLFRSALHGAAIGIGIMSVPRGRFEMVNAALCRLVGRPEEWFLDHGMDDLIHPDDLRSAHAQRRGLLEGAEDSMVGDIRLVRADGSVIWVRRAGALVRDAHGQPELVVVQIEDVTPQRTALETLEHIAFHDTLTGLPNRAYAMEALAAGLELDEGAVALLYLDLDRFALVNDSLGHASGDTLLTVLAARIGRRLRPVDTLARIGGDEFVVVMPRLADSRAAERAATQIIRAVAEPVLLEGHRLTPTVSIGIAVSEAGATPESLMRDADAALGRAKRRGRDRWEIADENLHRASVEQLVLQDELREAVARREFVVHFQPLVRLNSGETVGYEALVRWAHPVRGLLGPPAFMEVAESSGIVADIDRLVLENVCRTMAAGRLSGRVSVNVSAVDLRRGTWLDDTLAVIGEHRIDPARLVLEVTETTALAIPEAMRWGLERLCDLGVGLHVDDFGTGFSTISLLQDLPVTGLKLDARFVRTLTGHREERADALAAGLCGLAHGLGLVGVAEGVETPDQWAILRAQGWAEGQGWLFGRPAAVL